MPPRPTLFLSYRRTQIARVKPVVNFLTSAGIGCFLDVNDIDPLAAFPETIRAGIDRSHAFLAWWSLDYIESDHCLQEFRRAWQHARRHSSDVSQRIWILNPETTLDHITAGELKADIYLRLPVPGTETIWANDLLERLQALIPEGPLADERTQRPVPSMYGVPTKSSEFTGRGRELMSIHSQLHPAQIGATGAAVAVQTHGMGGVGKTELATAYANDFAMAYPGGIYWLNLAGWTPSDPAREQDGQAAWLRALEHTLGLDTERVLNLTRDQEGKVLSPAAVREGLAEDLDTVSAYLWILDNLPELTPLDVRDRILDFIRAPTANGRTLLTTRDGRTADGFAEEKLDVLGENDAIRLLARFRRQQAHTELEAIRDLVQEVGAHTQALTLLGESARNNPGGYPRVLERVLVTGKLDRIEQIAEQLKTQLGTGARGIVATFELSIDLLDDAAKELLSLAGVCAPNLAIPDALLAAAFGDAAREDDFVASLAELLRASLLTRRSDKVGSVFIHPLVAATATWLLEPDGLTLRQRVADSLLSRISTGDIRTYAEIGNDIQQTRELAPLLEELRGVQMFLWLGRYEYTRGSFREAGTLEAQGLALAKRVLGEEHPETLAAMNNLAVTLQVQGDLGGARARQEQVLAIVRRVRGEEHLDTLSAISNLAVMLQAQGDLCGARLLLEQALPICRRALGEEHLNTLAAINNLAVTLQAQGELSGARALHEQALSIRRRVLGEEHPDTLTSMNNLAATLQAQGELSRARALHEQALAIRRRVLGEEHPDTLAAINDLAVTLQAQGDLSGARARLEQALAIARRVLGEEHPTTLTSINNLARTLSSQGNNSGARALQEEVLSIRNRALGKEHPDTTISAWNLFLTLRNLEDFVSARALLDSDLLWLVDRDPADLGADQHEIRKYILQLMKDSIQSTLAAPTSPDTTD